MARRNLQDRDDIHLRKRNKEHVDGHGTREVESDRPGRIESRTQSELKGGVNLRIDIGDKGLQTQRRRGRDEELYIP